MFMCIIFQSIVSFTKYTTINFFKCGSLRVALHNKRNVGLKIIYMKIGSIYSEAKNIYHIFWYSWEYRKQRQWKELTLFTFSANILETRHDIPNFKMPLSWIIGQRCLHLTVSEIPMVQLKIETPIQVGIYIIK